MQAHWKHGFLAPPYLNNAALTYTDFDATLLPISAQNFWSTLILSIGDLGATLFFWLVYLVTWFALFLINTDYFSPKIHAMQGLDVHLDCGTPQILISDLVNFRENQE